MTLSLTPIHTVNRNQLKQENLYKTEDISLIGTDCVIRSQVSLAPLTSYRVGGPAQWYVAPRNVSDLQASWIWAKSQNIPITLIGAGSNLLISDRGLPGLVICTRYLRHIHFDDTSAQVTAAAGEPIAKIAWQVAERGWQGIEWAVGIPGSVGGSVVMNAGAHQGCVADRLINVQVLTVQGELITLLPAQLGYSYRTSILQKGGYLVTEAKFQLIPGGDPTDVTNTTDKMMEHRRTTQPYNLPSCGSVFRNPEPFKSAKLIEQTGLKGYTIGSAQVSTRHANFIVNCGGAKADDIYQLIRYVQKTVAERWSIELEPEVKILGDFSI